LVHPRPKHSHIINLPPETFPLRKISQKCRCGRDSARTPLGAHSFARLPSWIWWEGTKTGKKERERIEMEKKEEEGVKLEEGYKEE